MSNITGHLYFDRQRTRDVQGLQGIANVPIVLQSVYSPYLRLAVLTDEFGAYAFHNVPQGEYRIVEAYGVAAIPSPGDFSEATPGVTQYAVVPPINYAPNPPNGATNLDCVTPNTIFVTVGADHINQMNFLNGPVRYVPINVKTDNCVEIDMHNLLEDADFGTMGTFTAGTAANTGVPIEPYPENVLDFDYVLPLSHPVQTPGYPPWFHAPEDGEYTVQNILNDDNSNRIGAWWRIADHTIGNETGRFMLVNGDTPGAVFFSEEVEVKPNQYYLFSAWIINMFKAHGWAEPKLGVKIYCENGKELYKATLGALIPVNTVVPEWKEIGTALNSRNNTKLTVQFLSEGPAEIGNDYAIDDISLREITVPVFTPVKSIDKSIAYVGESVEYTVVLRNTCTLPLTHVTFLDKLPQGLEFIPGSVTVNGTPMLLADPETGFALPDILGGERVTVRFRALAKAAHELPVINMAEMSYEYTPVEGGISATYDVESNEVPLEIKRGEKNIMLLMSKIAIGAPLVGDEFLFGIFEPGEDDPLYTARNDEKGLIRFSNIHFSTPGEYHFTVKEIHAPSGWEKDDREWPIKIDVTHVEGELVVTVEYPEGVPVFVNKRHGETCGLFQFPDMTFDEAGVYHYTLRELTPSGDGWTTDDRVIRVVVTVVDDEHGHLVATIEYLDGFPTFTNIYRVKPTHIVISGCKIAIGAPLPIGRFEFGLFDSEGRLIAKTTNAAADEVILGDE